MIFAVILIAESLSGLKGCIRFILSKSTLGGHPNVFLFVIFMFSTWGILVANWNEYSAYFRVSKSNQNNALYDIIPLRVLAIIDSVPHKSIATNSSYPLLFLSRQLYPNRYPFVEDLSAGVNLSRDDITRSQIDTLKTNKIDIVVVKTSTEFSNTPSDFDKVLENYSLIVEFPKPSENPVIAPHAERVYFSKSLIERQFINIGAEIKNKDYIVKADGASLIKLTNLATCSVMATTDGNPHAISRSNKGDLYIWAVGAKNIKYHLTGYCGPMKILRFATNNAISDQ